MDNTFVIDNLLRQNESDVLEFKEKYFLEVIAKNVTAMLNNRGGDILVGITDDKRVIGIDKGIQIEKLLSRLLSGITPSAPIDVQLVDYDGKNILMIRVWEGSQKPYSYKGTIYQKRKVASTRSRPLGFGYGRGQKDSRSTAGVREINDNRYRGVFDKQWFDTEWKHYECLRLVVRKESIQILHPKRYSVVGFLIGIHL